MLKCIAASEKILPYLNETSDINKQIKEKNARGVSQRKYIGVFPLHFYFT